MFRTALIKPSSTKATKIALLRQETVFRIYLSGHRNQFLRPWSSIIQFLVLNCYLNLLLIFCPFESKADVFARIVWDHIIVSPVKPGTGRERTLNVAAAAAACLFEQQNHSINLTRIFLKVFVGLNSCLFTISPPLPTEKAVDLHRSAAHMRSHRNHISNGTVLFPGYYLGSDLWKRRIWQVQQRVYNLHLKRVTPILL